MVSLWGNKSQNGDDPVDNHDGTEEVVVVRPRSREPDERTRLLAVPPRPSRADGYLDPDDPAVGRLSKLHKHNR